MIEFKANTSPLYDCVNEALITYGATTSNIVVSVCDKINLKFESLGVSYLSGIESIATAKALMSASVFRDMPLLLSMTNNLKELSSIPVNDSTIHDFEQSTNAFSMNEDSPIDNTENITTPFVKSKTNSGNKYTDTVTHNTVHEAKERQEISSTTVYTFMSFCEKVLESVIEEFNTAY